MPHPSILELKICKGTLSWRDNSIEIEFKLSCGQDGSIAVSSNPIPLSLHSQFLLELSSARKRKVEEFTLSGLGPDGERIETKSAHLTNCVISSGEDQAVINLEISTARLDLSWQYPPTTNNSGEPMYLEYQIPGLECWGTVEVEVPYGKVRVTGATGVKDYTVLTGCITITPTLSIDPLENTHLEEFDSNARRLLDILSLAEGRFMRWSIRRIILGGQVRSAVFYGPKRSTEPRFPLFSFLNLQPIVSMAVEQYTEELCKVTGIDIAIEWFLMHPRYSEAQFLTGMTALEHLIHVFEKQHPQGVILPKDTFKKQVWPQLWSALNNAFKTVRAEILAERHEAHEVMSRKLDQLNQQTFPRKLQALLNHHGVPIADIKAEIPLLIRLRNNIVHMGHRSAIGNAPSLSYYVAVLRELLTRVFLSLLKYKGEYQSFLDGPEWKQFSLDQE